MGKTKILSLIILIGIFTSCNNQPNSILEIGKGKDIMVTFEILDNTGIEKIVFQANGNSELVSSRSLAKYRIVKYGFNGEGEGTFKVCVYTKTDTICSEQYVEGGYRPKLKYIDNRIEVDSHIGNGY